MQGLITRIYANYAKTEFHLLLKHYYSENSMKSSKQIFSDWLEKETKKFRKSMPKGATHYKIGKNKVKWLRLGSQSDGMWCGYFMKYSKKKKGFYKPIRIAWDHKIHNVYW